MSKKYTLHTIIRPLHLPLLPQAPTSTHPSRQEYEHSPNHQAHAGEHRQPDIAARLRIQDRSGDRVADQRREADHEVMRAESRAHRAHVLGELCNDCRKHGDKRARAKAVEAGDEEEHVYRSVTGLKASRDWHPDDEDDEEGEGAL